MPEGCGDGTGPKEEVPARMRARCARVRGFRHNPRANHIPRPPFGHGSTWGVGAGEGGGGGGGLPPHTQDVVGPPEGDAGGGAVEQLVGAPLAARERGADVGEDGQAQGLREPLHGLGTGQGWV